MDGLLLAALLPLALPLMAIIAFGNLLVFGDPRQIFYRQPRVGWKGETFSIVKFRTMKATSSSAIGSWSSGEDHLRVTTFGKFLRNAHLDELPQLFNIIAGEMSFIGPRPEMIEIEEWASEEIPGFSNRLAIRPGLAGLAQITQGYTGHDVEAYSEKLDINLSYMAAMGLGLDLRIVIGTAIWMVRGKGWEWNQPAAHESRSEETTSIASQQAPVSNHGELEPAPAIPHGSRATALAEIPDGIEPEWSDLQGVPAANSRELRHAERRAS